MCARSRARACVISVLLFGPQGEEPVVDSTLQREGAVQRGKRLVYVIEIIVCFICRLPNARLLRGFVLVVIRVCEGCLEVEVNANT